MQGNTEEGNMGNYKTLEEAREQFKNDLFATESGMGIEELSDDMCICSVELSDRHRNAYGGVMGGAIFTLGDLAFAAASNNRHYPTVAQQVSINYLNAAKGRKLYAKAICKKDGLTTCVYNVDIYDDTGRDVAQFIAEGYKLSGSKNG